MADQKTGIKVLIAKHMLASGLGVVALLVLLATLFVFRPMWADIRAANRQAALAEEKAAKLRELAQLQELLENYDAFDRDEVERVRAMIPSEEDIPGLLATFEAAARQSDIALTAVNFAKGELSGAAKDLTGVSAVSVTLALQHGDYGRFKLFLEALEGSLRLFDVVGANANPSGASYTLTIRAYVLAKN
jgi:hypothetical protein